MLRFNSICKTEQNCEQFEQCECIESICATVKLNNELT